MSDEIPRTYVLVRADLPIATQMVQVAHACLQAGHRFRQPQYSHLVFCSVPDEASLIEAHDRNEAWGVPSYMFHEPDDGVGYTAICTGPVAGAGRKPFRRYPLWKEP